MNFLLLTSNTLGCIKIAKENGVNFRIFQKKKKSVIFASISESIANKEHIINEIINGKYSDYKNIDPSFIKNCLLTINDITKTDKERNKAKENLYNQALSRNHHFDDDNLSDLISYCEEGELSIDNLDEIVEELLEFHLPMDWQIHCEDGKEYHLFGDKLFPVNK